MTTPPFDPKYTVYKTVGGSSRIGQNNQTRVRYWGYKRDSRLKNKSGIDTRRLQPHRRQCTVKGHSNVLSLWLELEKGMGHILTYDKNTLISIQLFFCCISHLTNVT